MTKKDKGWSTQIRTKKGKGRATNLGQRTGKGRSSKIRIINEGQSKDQPAGQRRTN